MENLSGTSSHFIKQTLQVNGFASRLQRKLISKAELTKGANPSPP